MSLLTLNGEPIISGEIRMPRVGLFDGEFYVDTTKIALEQSVFSTDDGSFQLQCAPHAGRNAEFLQSLRVHVVAGKGGLANTDYTHVLEPKAYNGYTVRAVLTDILKDSGESLSSTTDPNLLNRFLPRWSRLGGTAKNAIHALLSFAGCDAWRVLGDGTFFATMAEPWPRVASKDFEVISRNLSENWCLIASERPFALPGQVIELPSEAAGSANPIQQISAAIHTFEPGLVQCRLYFEDAA
jgi:hypothetical protein